MYSVSCFIKCTKICNAARSQNIIISKVKYTKLQESGDGIRSGKANNTYNECFWGGGGFRKISTLNTEKDMVVYRS